MDRLEALNKLPELSAGCLDAQTEAAVRRWVEDCPHCKAEWHSLETMMATLGELPPAPLSEQQSRQMWSRCNEALFDKIESQRLQQKNPGLGSWMRSQPRWGWAMLGGAAVALGAAMFAPDTSSSPSTPNRTLAVVDGRPRTSTTNDAGGLQMFSRPPSYAATMVDHHGQMAADPFTDRVGSTLVSYSASSEGASQ